MPGQQRVAVKISTRTIQILELSPLSRRPTANPAMTSYV